MQRLLIISLLGLLFYACNNAKDADSPNHGLGQVVGINALGLAGQYSLKPDTFSVFLWPEKIDWQRDFYKDLNPNNQRELRARCSRTVVKFNDLHDQLDRELNSIELKKKPLQARYDELECDLNFEDECETLEEKISEFDLQITSKIPLKEDYIRTIVEALDRDYKKPQNYKVKLDNRYLSQIQLFPTKPEDHEAFLENPEDFLILKFKKFGVNEQDYSIGDGIGNIHFDLHAALLEFTLFERDATGYFTGFSYDFKLSISRFLNKLRLVGDVHYKNSDGQILRRGSAKIDLPASER